MRVAIMQPAFIPSRSYFRLFEAVDLFCVLDCVQFNRRWYSHRNKLKDSNGNLHWLTLPLKHAPQETAIEQMVFADDGVSRMGEAMRRFPAFGQLSEPIVAQVRNARGALVTYLVDLLESCCRELKIEWNVCYSSALAIAPTLRGQDRILEICRRLGATEYVNSPGGRALYDEVVFAERGLKLEFLAPWTGSHESVLQTIAEMEAA